MTAPRGRQAAVAAALVLGVAAVYGRSAGHGFISFDDNIFVTANPWVESGLTAAGLRESFRYQAANWHPLTWLSHMLDVQLFGMWAGGHHLMSAALHAASAALLFGVLAALTGAFWRSAAVAALFALHPLRVESVSWVAARCHVLATLLLLLALGAYARYVRRPGPGRYAAVALLFAAGLMSKPIVVTLPFALLLLDWWPLGRFQSSSRGAAPPHASPFAKGGSRGFLGPVPSQHPGGPAVCAPGRRGRWPALIVEKLPLLALSVASSVVAYIGQTTDVIPAVKPDAVTRLSNAAVSAILYLRDFVWPSGLALLYPYPTNGIPAAEALGAAAALALLTAAAVLVRRRRPYLAAGWFWYLGTLVPVIGFVQIGAQSRSDRYTTISQIGIAIGFVWLAADSWPRRRWARSSLAAAVCAALAALGVTANAYVRVWSDSLAVYAHALSVTEGNANILGNYGGDLFVAGRFEEAARALQEAVRLRPELCEGHYNLGNALSGQRRHPEALAAYERALACYLSEGQQGAYLVDAYVNLGNTCLALGRPAAAERHFRALLRIEPAHRAGLIGLGEAVARQRRRRESDPR